jgi:hypothetical protein
MIPHVINPTNYLVYFLLSYLAKRNCVDFFFSLCLSLGRRSFFLLDGEALKRPAFGTAGLKLQQNGGSWPLRTCLCVCLPWLPGNTLRVLSIYRVVLHLRQGHEFY